MSTDLGVGVGTVKLIHFVLLSGNVAQWSVVK